MLLSTVLAAIGQFAFKAGLNNSTYFIPLLVGGIAMYYIAAPLYFFVLSRTHLSWTYGVGGISNVIAVLLAMLVLNETVPVLRWVGVGIIFSGVVLVATSD